MPADPFGRHLAHPMIDDPQAPPPANKPNAPGIGIIGVALTLLGILLLAGVVFMIVSWEPGTAPRGPMNPDGPEPPAEAAP